MVVPKQEASKELTVAIKIEEPSSASSSSLNASAPPSPPSPSSSKRRKDLFGDCALVEIIHLHDCLRGALKALERDVNVLGQNILLKGESERNNSSELTELERRVAGRFKVIWSVFRAHSSAEDEFIWPTLRSKTQGRVKGSPSYRPGEEYGNHSHTHEHQHPEYDSAGQNHLHSHDHHNQQQENQHQLHPEHTVLAATGLPAQGQESNGHPNSPSKTTQPRMSIEQGEYEEDHADEERMFSKMDNLLTKLRSGLVQEGKGHGLAVPPPWRTPSTAAASIHAVASLSKQSPALVPPADDSVNDIMHDIHDLTKTLSKHLMAHLEKEEKQCMPLVVKHLTKSEIHDLVGKIMGKRSSDMIAQIMTMAVQNLNDADREEMVKYMQQAMAGTFFDRWLSMSGWMKNDIKKGSQSPKPETTTSTEIEPASLGATSEDSSGVAEGKGQRPHKRLKTTGEEASESVQASPSTTATRTDAASVEDSSFPHPTSTFATEVTSQAELEHLIRAIASNQNLTPLQKNTTIQGLRDSVWKSNQRIRRNAEAANGVEPSSNSNNCVANHSQAFTMHRGASSGISSAATSAFCTTTRRVTPPANYYKKNAEGKVEIAWNSDGPPTRCPDDGTVPFFSASELAPSYHDGATGAVLGCPHYARACKLRHPESGRLYTCRLCCSQERELPTKDQDEPLDRYAVTEVMCMKCTTLQPADDRCLNQNCESRGKAFAKYYCRICHLYDDRPRPIFHCPYCNTCRMGLGLGIDFRHCMRCNACVSLEDKEHRCIPQKLQGSCPICHELLFQSTEPLRGLKCGHVMHLSCFSQYRRGQCYTCPLCMRSMEDMSDYFALLDAAVRMQPMPTAYLTTISNIYCQDCAKTGQCQYHFVGQKCPHCGSYNTREMGRLQATDNITAT